MRRLFVGFSLWLRVRALGCADQYVPDSIEHMPVVGDSVQNVIPDTLFHPVEVAEKAVAFQKLGPSLPATKASRTPKQPIHFAALSNPLSLAHSSTVQLMRVA